MTTEYVEVLDNIGFEWFTEDEDNEFFWADLIDSETWRARWEELRMYKAERGNCLVSKKYRANSRLGGWVHEQRRQHRLLANGEPSSLNQVRIKALDMLGFVWNLKRDPIISWETRYEQLKLYKTEHGNCQVPKRYAKNQQLGTWVHTQRKLGRQAKEGKTSSISKERIELLEKLGFAWNLKREGVVSWEVRYMELRAYKTQHGNCLVPKTSRVSPQLGSWVHEQRRQYRLMREGKSSPMTPERIKALEELGFVWAPKKIELASGIAFSWENGLEHLNHYKSVHGNCFVPIPFPTNPQLETWVQTQRDLYRLSQEGESSSMLTPERIETLEKMGFVWSPKNSVNTNRRNVPQSIGFTCPPPPKSDISSTVGLDNT